MTQIYKVEDLLKNITILIALIAVGYQPQHKVKASEPVEGIQVVTAKVVEASITTETYKPKLMVMYIEPEVKNIELPTDQQWFKKRREERAKIIYEAMCNSSGWWGMGCPTEVELVAWLVFEEGATLSPFDQSNMAKGIRYRFAHLTKNSSFLDQLSAYTAFFNPDGDLTLDYDDWKDLLAPDIDMNYYIDIAEKVYAKDIEHSDGNYLYWWAENEINRNGNSPGELGKDYLKTNTSNGTGFYFTGIPNVRDCFTRGEHCR